MKQQVDKLIANALLTEGEVYLPEVGTLILSRQAAKLLSAKQLQAPRRELRFTREQRCASIIDHIMHVAGVSAERANDIYAEWLNQSLREGVLTIGLVCTIENGKITTDEVFEGVANTESNKIIKIKPRKNRVARFMVAFIVCASLGVTGYYLYMGGVVDPAIEKLQQMMASNTKVEQPVAPQPIEVEPTINEADSTAIATMQADSTAVVLDETIVDSTAVATTEPATEPLAEQTTTEPTTTVEQNETQSSSNVEILELRSRYSYAVWGVYRELKNAEDAIAWLAEKHPSIETRIYRYGNRHMVTLCEMESRNACGRQVSRWKAQYKSFKSVWVYTK